jgi:hypothetical protein
MLPPRARQLSLLKIAVQFFAFQATVEEAGWLQNALLEDL